MSDSEEQAYVQGSANAWRAMLQQCIMNLGGEDRDRESWRLERADVVSALRNLCRDFGDNDWDDDMRLADVIERHLAKDLYDAIEAEGE